MTRLMIISIFVLCFIILTSGTQFLKTLLTTSTTPSTHISDFRNLPRRDSRADKPDAFPGFDFIDETTTVRIKTPLDFYTKFIGGVVGQGRQTYERIVSNIQRYEIKRRANLMENSHQNLVYIPVEQSTLAIENVADLSTEASTFVVKPSKEQNWPKKYFASLLTAAGLNKLRNASDPEYQYKNLGTYINPLVNLWKTTTKKLNFERDTTIQEPRQEQQYNQTTTDNDTNISSSPLQLNESIKANILSNPSSLAFRYALPKYLISKGYPNDDENKTVSEYSSESLGVPLGDVNLNNNNAMGVDVDFPIERIDEQNDGTENNDKTT